MIDGDMSPQIITSYYSDGKYVVIPPKRDSNQRARALISIRLPLRYHGDVNCLVSRRALHRLC
jgi:hypothetical protein